MLCLSGGRGYPIQSDGGYPHPVLTRGVPPILTWIWVHPVRKDGVLPLSGRIWYPHLIERWGTTHQEGRVVQSWPGVTHLSWPEWGGTLGYPMSGRMGVPTIRKDGPVLTRGVPIHPDLGPDLDEGYPGVPLSGRMGGYLHQEGWSTPHGKDEVPPVRKDGVPLPHHEGWGNPPPPPWCTKWKHYLLSSLGWGR